MKTSPSRYETGNDGETHANGNNIVRTCNYEYGQELGITTRGRLGYRAEDQKEMGGARGDEIRR